MNKGEKSDCYNYRGITLLSIAGKVLARVLLNRLVPTIAEEKLPECQCGYRADRHGARPTSTPEKCQEQNKGLYGTLVDFTKAIDSVSRTRLWLILKRLGCPSNLLEIVIQLHEIQHSQIRLNGALLDHFPITNGVKQGCVLVPTLFSKMLKEATDDLDDEDGVHVGYRMDGTLQTTAPPSQHQDAGRLTRNLLIADDVALVAHTEQALKRVTSSIEARYTKLRSALHQA